jgi:hypothetical protein
MDIETKRELEEELGLVELTPEEQIEKKLHMRKWLKDACARELSDLLAMKLLLDALIAKAAEPFNWEIEDCERDIRNKVLDLGESVKTASATATYIKPFVRRSCKYDALEGYGKAHPEVLEFITYKDVAARVSIKVH